MAVLSFCILRPIPPSLFLISRPPSPSSIASLSLWSLSEEIFSLRSSCPIAFRASPYTLSLWRNRRETYRSKQTVSLSRGKALVLAWPIVYLVYDRPVRNPPQLNARFIPSQSSSLRCCTVLVERIPSFFPLSLLSLGVSLDGLPLTGRRLSVGRSSYSNRYDGRSASVHVGKSKEVIHTVLWISSCPKNG